MNIINVRISRGMSFEQVTKLLVTFDNILVTYHFILAQYLIKKN